MPHDVVSEAIHKLGNGNGQQVDELGMAWRQLAVMIGSII
jgi:hypothetical protein